ncbi:MAG: nucleoside-diphosphate kinase [Calditrichia bacterium]|nr:nucleoside-diphosphate kinase [Calditrichia bacterium]
MEKTLSMIKPDCVKTHVIGRVLNMIEKKGFEILGMKEISLSRRDARRFYKIHAGKPFFNDLIEFMISGPVIVIALQRENAIEEYRKLIGATNPEVAIEGTVRKLFGHDTQKNCVHGSDSVINGEREVYFFFAERELDLP